MRICRCTTLACDTPHLKCSACEVYRKYREDCRRAFVPRGILPVAPDPRPYVKFETPSGRPGIEIGIEGTF